jgi:hypothetical protein
VKKITFLLLLLLAPELFLPHEVFAQVLINEFSSWGTSHDWVELFNIGDSPVDLSQYIIRDSTQTNKINLSGEIAPRGFATFDFSNRLNRSDDEIMLLELEDAKEISIDTVFYGGEGQVCAPGDGETVGRVTDGGNILERFSVGTRNTSNNSSTLDPCPAPTKTEIPTSKPTVTPTFLAEFTPTIGYSPSPVSRRLITQVEPSTVAVISKSSSGANTESVLSSANAASEGIGVEESVTVDGDKDRNFITLITRYFLPSILTIVGMIFVIYAFYLVTKRRKKRL